jgi:hypothetical protein
MGDSLAPTQSSARASISMQPRFGALAMHLTIRCILSIKLEGQKIRRKRKIDELGQSTL